MTNETTTDVVPTDGGGQASPTPDTSSQDAGQGSSSEESSNEAVLTRLGEVEGMLRRFQSDEDRGLHRVEQEVRALPTQFETYYKRREAGASHEQALREDVLDEIVAERSGTQSDTQVPPAGEPAAQTTVAVDEPLSAILNLTGLDSGEAEVVAILKQERDPLKQVVALTALAESRKQTKTTPAAVGNTLPMGTGAAVTEETFETVSAELQELHEQPKMDFEKNRELNAKLKKLQPITK